MRKKFIGKFFPYGKVFPMNFFRGRSIITFPVFQKSSYEFFQHYFSGFSEKVIVGKVIVGKVMEGKVIVGILMVQKIMVFPVPR